MNTKTTATSVNINTTKNHGFPTKLRYESKAQALETFKEMLVDGLKLTEDEAQQHTDQLANNTSGVSIDVGENHFYYCLVEMMFEGGERVSITYLDGTYREGTVVRRTAAKAQQVGVKMDHNDMVFKISPQNLVRL